MWSPMQERGSYSRWSGAAPKLGKRMAQQPRLSPHLTAAAAAAAAAVAGTLETPPLGRVQVSISTAFFLPSSHA